MIANPIFKPDGAILMTLRYRAWNIVAGAIMMLMVSVQLTDVEQGYYYTFSSVIGLQVFFELGLNFVIVQFVSHEAAKFTWSEDQGIGGPQRELNRVGNLIVDATRWFRVTSISFALCVGVGGIWFFTSIHGGDTPAQWLPAWLVLVTATALNLYYSPQLAIMEGLGRVREVSRLRLFQSVIGFLLCWILLALFPGLLAAASIAGVACLSTGLWLHRRGSLRDIVTRRTRVDERISWRQEVWPMQWRIAVSWACGYLIFQSLIPMVFAWQGPVAAGQLGLSLTVFASITSVSMSWFSAKLPTMGTFIANRQREPLRALFRTLMLESSIANIAISLGALSVFALIQQANMVLATRLLPMPDLLVLAAVAIVNHCIFSMAAFMRAHKEEPLLFSSVVGAILVASSSYFLSAVSVHHVVIGYFLLTVCVGLLWTLAAFRRYWAMAE